MGAWNGIDVSSHVLTLNCALREVLAATDTVNPDVRTGMQVQLTARGWHGGFAWTSSSGLCKAEYVSVVVCQTLGRGLVDESCEVSVIPLC